MRNKVGTVVQVLPAKSVLRRGFMFALGKTAAHEEKSKVADSAPRKRVDKNQRTSQRNALRHPPTFPSRQWTLAVPEGRRRD